MSFRNRLRLFFGLIVIVPMVALGTVLFALTARSETGKADAGIVAGGRAAVGLYREEVDRARPAVRRLARDRALQGAITSGDKAATARRLRELVAGPVHAAELWTPGGGGSRMSAPGRRWRPPPPRSPSAGTPAWSCRCQSPTRPPLPTG